MNKQLNLLMEWNNIEKTLLVEECKYLTTFKEDSNGFIEKIRATASKIVEWFKNAFNNFKTQYNEFKANKKLAAYEKIINKYKENPKFKDGRKIFVIQIVDSAKLSDVQYKLTQATTEEEISKLKNELNAIVANGKKKPIFLNNLQDATSSIKSTQKFINDASASISVRCKNGISEGNKLANVKEVGAAGKLKDILSKLKTAVMNGMYCLGLGIRLLVRTLNFIYGPVVTYSVGLKRVGSVEKTI